MAFAYSMKRYAETIANAQHKRLASIANVLIHVMQRNHAASMLNVKYLIRFQFER